MTKYMFLFRGGDAARPDQKTSPDESQAHMMKWRTWMESLGKAGKLISGEPLQKGGRVLTGRTKKVTDGPFIEGREVVGGYLLVTAANLDEATELSRGCPIFEHDGSVEVREVQKMDV